MTKNKIALFSSAVMGAALFCGPGVAKAQGYNGAYDSPPYYYRVYSDGLAPTDETVIVHPFYDHLQTQQLVGHINGEVDPVEFSISRPVDFSDLDLSRDSDFFELRARIHDTALNLCAELDARVPELRGDREADRECVRTATHNAMRDVLHRLG